MPEKSFIGRFENLSEISRFVLENIKVLRFTDFDIYAIETAVDEACSNIIEHAYKGRNNGIICVEVITESDRVHIKLTDNGIRFDPKKIKPPNLKCPLEERSNHGLGLYFIYQWMDQVDFSFTDNSNQLVMTKIKN